MADNEKILVVDDDPDIRTVLTALLESKGYQVVTASDGREGLDTLKAEKPDLMILDLLMSEMDGFTVMKKLKERVSPWTWTITLKSLSILQFY
jgi:two-component system OmpR family response regulator